MDFPELLSSSLPVNFYDHYYVNRRAIKSILKLYAISEDDAALIQPKEVSAGKYADAAANIPDELLQRIRLWEAKGFQVRLHRHCHSPETSENRRLVCTIVALGATNLTYNAELSVPAGRSFRLPAIMRRKCSYGRCAASLGSEESSNPQCTLWSWR